jgi:hypothetical protein
MEYRTKKTDKGYLVEAKRFGCKWREIHRFYLPLRRDHKFYKTREEVDKAIEEFKKKASEREQGFPYHIFDDLV